MNRFRWVGVWAAILVWLSVGAFCTHAADDDEKPDKAETVIIPLDKIWALNMPGTRDIGNLETNKPPNYAYGPLVAQIRRSLSKTPPRGNKAKAGFAVLGTGLDALRQAHEVITEDNRPHKVFPLGDEISIVFFSHEFGHYVHLHRVERQGNVVNICYRFIPHETDEVTEHVAIFQLANLSAGKYRVNIVRSPMEQRLIDLGFRSISDADACRIVCSSFSFSVAEKGK